MKSEKLFSAFGNISDEYIASAAPENRRKQRPVFRSVVALATAAAVIALAVFGNTILRPDNVFSVKAYAMEQQADGTATYREVAFVGNSDTWCGYSDGKDFYLNVGLKSEGKNIKSVEFSIDDNCFFAKRHVDAAGMGIPIENAPMLYGGGKDYLALAYNEFEKVGSNITLDSSMLNNDLILFLGKENADLKNHPEKMTVHTLVTFNNGKTEEQTITLDLSGMSSFLAFADEHWNEYGTEAPTETKIPTETEAPAETATPTETAAPTETKTPTETNANNQGGLSEITPSIKPQTGAVDKIVISKVTGWNSISTNSLREKQLQFASRYDYHEGDFDKSFDNYPGIIYTSGVEYRENGTKYECPAIYADEHAAVVNSYSFKKGEAKFIINGQETKDSDQFISYNGKVLVPVEVFTALGCALKSDKDLYVTTLSKNGTVLEILSNLIGMRKNQANGFYVPLEVCARVADGRFYVPVQAVANEFNIKTDWNSDTLTLTLDSIN